MSRRSVLLATTIYFAIGSLASVGPASAHGFGFGGFGGGSAPAPRAPASASISRAPVQSMGNFGGGRFGHAPSIGTPSTESAGVRMQPSRIPAAANAAVGNTPAAAQFVRPGQSPQTNISSAIGAPRQVDAAGIVRPSGSVAAQIRDIGDGRGKLQRPGSTNDVPNVAGPDTTVFGQGSSHGPKSSDLNGTGGPGTNLPGSMRQKGPGSVSGGGDGVLHLNVPGSTAGNSVADANKKFSEWENAGKDLLNQATQGGPNSLNIPGSAGAGVAASDDAENGEKNAGKSGSKPAGGGKGGGGDKSGNPLKVAPGVYGSNGGGPTADGGSQTVSTMQDGKTVTQVETTKDSAGNITSIIVRETKGGKDKGTVKSDGPSLPAKKNNTPDDNASTSTGGSLSSSSGIAKRDNGGGTGNNGESSNGQSSQLAPGSLGRIGNGDGTGGHGDHGSVGNDGTLAAGSSLARNNYGDGGDSDTRGGGTTAGGVRVGGPHQSNAAALSH